MNKARVLSHESDPKSGARYRLRERQSVAAIVLAAIGAAFVAVGLVDLTLAWLPLQFGTAGWEFAIISQTFTSLPMTLLGLGLVAYGSAVHPGVRPLWIRVLAVVSGVSAAGLIALGLVYAMATVQVVSATPSEAMPGLVKAVLKNGWEILVYPALLGFLSVLLWRAVVRES